LIFRLRHHPFVPIVGKPSHFFKVPRRIHGFFVELHPTGKWRRSTAKCIAGAKAPSAAAAA
jgi:hypothetical protein